MEILEILNFVCFLSICLSSFGMFFIALCRLPENPVLHFIGLAILVFGINVYFLLMVRHHKPLVCATSRQNSYLSLGVLNRKTECILWN